MGPLIVLIFWGSVSFLLLLFAGLSSLIVWLIAKPKKLPLRAALIGLPIFVAAAPALYLVSVLVVQALEPPHAKFAAVFGVSPPASISSLKAHESFGTDFGEIHLAFNARVEDVASIASAMLPVRRDTR